MSIKILVGAAIAYGVLSFGVDYGFQVNNKMSEVSSKDNRYEMYRKAAFNENTPKKILVELASKGDIRIKHIVSQNKNTPKELKEELNRRVISMK